MPVNSLPNSGSGQEITGSALTITPISASNILWVHVDTYLGISTGADDNGGLAIFRDNVLVGGRQTYMINGRCAPISCDVAVTAGSTAPTTFRFRYGSEFGSNTTYMGRRAFNAGWDGTNLFTGTLTEMTP